MGEGQGMSILKTQATMAKEAGLDSPMQVGSILKIFEKYGIVDKGFEGEAEEGFRGRGVTLAHDRMSTDRLPIDWEKQKLLEDEAYFKLEQVKRLLFFPSCRKRFILEYFGDTEDLETLGENCGACDYCIEKEKFLSGGEAVLVHLSVFEIVLDAIEKYDGKFGGKRMADFLVGNAHEVFSTRGMDNDEEYGILREYSGDLVLAVIESLVHGGYLEKASGLYPVLSCTRKGKFSVRREAALRSDETELQSGVAMKVKSDVFKKDSKKKKDPKEKSSVRTGTDTLLETLALFRQGMDVPGIAQERGMAAVTIEGHIIKLFEEKKLSHEDIMVLVDPEYVEQVREVVRTDFAEGVEKLKHVKDRLAELGRGDVSYFAIKVGVAMGEKGEDGE